jgi:hypothetical protein
MLQHNIILDTVIYETFANHLFFYAENLTRIPTATYMGTMHSGSLHIVEPPYAISTGLSAFFVNHGNRI